jgi:hypothetical protein
MRGVFRFGMAMKDGSGNNSRADRESRGIGVDAITSG